MAQSAPNTPTDKVRKLLTVSAWTVAVEALVLAAFTLYLLWGLLSGQAKTISGEALLVLLYGAAAAWIAYVALSLRKNKRWARSAAVFWQTCQLFIAYQSFTGRGASWLIGGFLVVTSVVVLVLVLNPAISAESKNEIDSGR